ncbi:MAG: SCO1664 family protein [Candidatus Nanopelagicales bacterium]
MSDASLLRDGHLQVLGRLPDSSNNALLCSIGDGSDIVRVVYKPEAGERPLWDFPSRTLSRREKAAAVLDGLFGWGLVPATAWRDEGPAGPGMVQRWVEGVVDLGVFPPDGTPSGWVSVVDAQTDAGPVVVAHRVDEQTMQMILFDAVANNADRKGGHLLRTPTGLFGIDHGVTFHEEAKLRTVLWGKAGSPIPDQLLPALESVIANVSELEPWLSAAEVVATRERASALLHSGRFPVPSGQWPALPWPLI